MTAPLMRTSPSAAILIRVPGIGRPTDPIFWADRTLSEEAAVVSVNP